MAKKSFLTVIRKWSRPVHRDLSFFFTGVLLIYAVSGFVLNHKRDFNSNYSVTRQQFQIGSQYPRVAGEWDKAQAETLLAGIGEEGNFLKLYSPGQDEIKIFIRGGSSLTIDLTSGGAVYESLRKRPVISALNRLHYNPSRWWTIFSDIFLVSLVVIILSGLIMTPGRKGLQGRGGIELLIGMAIPLLFIFLV